jgi:hypothetical protein
MDGANRTLTSIQQQDRNAIGGSDANGSSAFVRDQTVAVRLAILKPTSVADNVRMYLPQREMDGRIC